MKARNNSEQVCSYFDTCLQNLTPASVGHVANVLFVPFSCDPDVSRLCASVLSDAELQRADRFVSEANKDLFLQRRAFRRFCGAAVSGFSRPLPEMVFEETENGRPYLSEFPEFRFSFSSCNSGFLGALSSSYGIGVDIEDKTEALDALELSHRYFSNSETRAVEQAGGQDRLQVFLQLWTLKEAALKSIGEGLPFGLEAFQFELDPLIRVVHAPLEHRGPESFSAHMIEKINGCAALVIKNSR